MSIFRDFFVKEKPVFTGIARGVGGFAFGISDTAGGLAPVPAAPFTAKIVLVGGGGGGGIGQGSGGGGAGGVAFFDLPITLSTSYAVRIGNGGRGGSPISGGADGEYTEWDNNPSYFVGEGGNGGNAHSGGGNGNYQGGNGAGGGGSGTGGAGSNVPGPFSPYIFGGYNGGNGSPGGGGSGGNQGGGGGGAAGNGGHALGPGVPGTRGGGDGGSGKEVPTAYLPSTFTQTETGPQPGQFLGMLITQPDISRRSFAGGGGGGAEHGQAVTGRGGQGGGGKGGWGSPSVPAAGNTTYPPAGSTGQVYGPDGNIIHAEPGYAGRGGGGGGGGYTTGLSNGGGGGGGVMIIQSPRGVSITTNQIPEGNIESYLHPDDGYKYHIITGNNGTWNAPGTLISGTVSFGPNPN